LGEGIILDFSRNVNRILKLEVKKIVQGKATNLIYFKKLREAGDAVSYIKEMGAYAIELMNATSLKLVKERYPNLNIPGGKLICFWSNLRERQGLRGRKS
jgi:hypothetical protein